MTQTERELVSRARAGDTAAFEQLMLDSQDRVYTLCLRMTGNREDALDLAQETTPGGASPPSRGTAASPPGCTAWPATPASTFSGSGSGGSRGRVHTPWTMRRPPCQSRRTPGAPRRRSWSGGNCAGRWSGASRPCPTTTGRCWSCPGPARPPPAGAGHAGAVRDVLSGDRRGIGPGPGNGKIPHRPGSAGTKKIFGPGGELFPRNSV